MTPVNDSSGRASKVVSVRDALEGVRSGDTIAIGGSLMRRQPLALVRELIRRDVKELSLQTFATSLATDLLAGAGAVARWEGVYAGMWWYGLAPNFRRGVEAARIEVVDYSESVLVARLRAAAMGVDFLPVRPMPGTNMEAQGTLAAVASPFTGERFWAVPAAHADLTLVHSYASDEFGNIVAPLRRDTDDIDQLFARASTRLVVSVERLIPHEQVLAQPALTIIPRQLVSAVCVAPFGAHPAACDAYYDEDLQELEQYVEASAAAPAFQAYLDAHVLAHADHDAYLGAVGRDRLTSLKVGVHDE